MQAVIIEDFIGMYISSYFTCSVQLIIFLSISADFTNMTKSATKS